MGYSRIIYKNRCPDDHSHSVLMPMVLDFVQAGGPPVTHPFQYRVHFIFYEGMSTGEAFIEVWRQLEVGNEVMLGKYNATEIKRFKADIARMSDDNPTAEIELAPNLLFNGLFSHYPDPLEGWAIDSDTTGGGKISVSNNRLLIESPNTGIIDVINNKTTLENLVEYETILAVNKIVNNSEVKISLGTTAGATRNARSVYNELLISGGADFLISVEILSPDSAVELDYIILNKT